MNFLQKLFGSPKSEPRQSVTPSSQWAGYLASLLADRLGQGRFSELWFTAAFIHRLNHKPALCIGTDGELPVMAGDPDVLVYCYLKDVPNFASEAKFIEGLIQKSAEGAAVLSKYTKDNHHMEESLSMLAELPMVDQLAFGIACELQARAGRTA